MQDVRFGFQAAASDVAGRLGPAALYRPDVGLRAGPSARLRRGVAARASFQRLLSDAEPALDDGAHRRQISRPVARHLGAGAALVSSTAAGGRDRDAQQPHARHAASRHRPRHRPDGIRRLQHRHERRPCALRRSVSKSSNRDCRENRSRIADSSGTSNSRSAFVPRPSTSPCISTARSAVLRAPR